MCCNEAFKGDMRRHTMALKLKSKVGNLVFTFCSSPKCNSFSKTVDAVFVLWQMLVQRLVRSPFLFQQHHRVVFYLTYSNFHMITVTVCGLDR